MKKLMYIAGILLLFQTIPAYSGTVSFAGLNGTYSAPFVVSDMGIDFTFSAPSTDSIFTIANDSLIFGHRNGANSVDLIMFTLAVSQNVVLNQYTIDNNGTANGGTFDIELVGGPNVLLVDDANGSSTFQSYLFNTVSTDPLQLLAGETYKFTYDPNNGTSTTGLASLDYTSAVPVPAAVWLFGSALLGLAGFRRSKTNI